MTEVVTDAYAQYQSEIGEVRERIARFLLALEQLEVDPLSDDVQARFDSDGYLADLHIEPTAMRRYTNVELEELVTDVLRGTERQMSDAVRELVEEYGLSELLQAPPSMEQWQQ